LITRFSAIASGSRIGLKDGDPETAKETLKKRFVFDTASFPIPGQTTGLLQYVDAHGFLCGSDYPFTSLRAVESLVKDHETDLPERLQDVKDREALYRGNSRRLLKRECRK
jgi:hypothetical protein